MIKRLNDWWKRFGLGEILGMDLYGEKAAFGFFHDFTGLFVFALAFTGLLGVSKILEPKAK